MYNDRFFADRHPWIVIYIGLTIIIFAYQIISYICHWKSEEQIFQEKIAFIFKQVKENFPEKEGKKIALDLAVKTLHHDEKIEQIKTSSNNSAITTGVLVGAMASRK